MPDRLSLIGQRFGSLFVKDFAGIKAGHPHWLCLCDCGNTKVIRGYHLSHKLTKSCGCKSPFINKHGLSRTQTYQIWADMKQRCNNPKVKYYSDYGGRGIRVSAEWDTFAAFLKDMGERPPGLSIDRIDNDGNYCKENCRWATNAQQKRNTRRTRIMTAFGFTGCIVDIANHFGFTPKLVWGRLKLGWPIERAVSEPVHLENSRSHHAPLAP